MFGVLAQQSNDAEQTGLLDTAKLLYEDHWPWVNNSVVALVIGMLALVVWRVCTRVYWRESAKRVFALRRAQLSFAVLSVMILIGLLDSIAWRDWTLRDDGAGYLMHQGEPVSDPKGASLLDRLDRITFQLSLKGEKTYSAPWSKASFTEKETTQLPNGEVQRDFVKIAHPRQHPLGTDKVGRDVLYKSIKSIRTALIIGGFTTLIAIPFSIFFGLTAGYYGKWIDDLIIYLYTTIASIPRILLIIAFVMALGNGLFQICVIMGVTTWVYLGRLIRGEVMKLREMDYVHAARAAGMSGWRIQFQHILPNVFHLVVIQAVLLFSGLVLAEAVLSYLNVGVTAETYSWGSMINEGRLELARDPIIWWNLLAAFLFMLLLVLPANVFGDALRDALDPKLKDVS